MGSDSRFADLAGEKTASNVASKWPEHPGRVSGSNKDRHDDYVVVNCPLRLG